jgi:predicted  nucleic acid-binding Zn-ribbon protein
LESALSEGDDEYRAIAKRIVRLQERITSGHRRLESLQSQATNASGAVEQDGLPTPLSFLQNEAAQPESEMNC